MKNILTPTTRSKSRFFDKDPDNDNRPMIIVPRSMFVFLVIFALMEGGTLIWIFRYLWRSVPHGAH